MKKGGFKVVRTTTKRVSSLPSYKVEKTSKSLPQEDNISKQEAESVESSVGDAFEDLFGERGEETPAASTNSYQRHIRNDDDDEQEPDIKAESEKPKYSGPVVNEGVDLTRKGNEDADIDDMLERMMEATEKDEKRPTSTPSKDDSNAADFGDLFSFVRGEDDTTDTKQKEKEDIKEPKDIDTSSKRPLYGDSNTTTTIKTSYSFKSLPRIPSTFYKELQLQIEDLIFKFECLDNEYAALHKIGHNIHVETLELKKKVEL